jgi:hypothetical protein
MSEQLRLKVSIDGQETRRFALSAPVTHSRLVDLIQSVLPVEKSKLPFQVQYTDDEGELITIASDADLKEAVTLMQEMNQKALKLSIVSSSSGPSPAPAASAALPPFPGFPAFPAFDGFPAAAGLFAPAMNFDELKEAFSLGQESKEENPGAPSDAETEHFQTALQYLVEQFGRLDKELIAPEVMALVAYVKQVVEALQNGEKVIWKTLTQKAEDLAPIITSLPCFHEEQEKLLNSLEVITKFLVQRVESGLLYPIPTQFAPLLIMKSEATLKQLASIEGIPLQLAVILEHLSSFASKLETVESSSASEVDEKLGNVHEGVQCDHCKVVPIVGTRYKCTACHNFDLCETCEEAGVHPMDHELIKFRVPRAPRRHGFGHGARHGCHGGRKWRNSRFNPAPAAKATSPSPSPSRALKDGFSAFFVDDVNLPDKTQLEAGHFAVKTWKIRNDGKEHWDSAVKLQYLSGNKEILLDGVELYDVPLLQSNEVGDLSVPLSAPNKPGTYRTVFRLVRNGVQFGHHIWVEFVV